MAEFRSGNTQNLDGDVYVSGTIYEGGIPLASKYSEAHLAFSGLTGVATSGWIAGQIARFNGSSWQPVTLTSGAVGSGGEWVLLAPLA